jgi:membrane protease YdiL (CAAX protease family)
MNNNQQSARKAQEKNFSRIILFFLLAVRLIDEKLSTWLYRFEDSDEFTYWYSGGLYSLTILLLWLNRGNLEKINVDKYSLFLLFLGGFIWLIYIPGDLGALAIISLSFILWALYNKQFDFPYKVIKYPLEVWLLIFVSIGLVVAPVFYYRLENNLEFDIYFLLVAIAEAHLALVVFEEVLFRGVLWAFLESLGLSNKVIVFLQAFLFWVSHHKYMALDNPYLFWFAVPLNALLLGVIVWRSKSLTPSIICHFLYNTATAFVLNALT